MTNSRQGSTGNVIAAICSFVIPGLGQLFQGRLIKAVLMFVLGILLWGFMIFYLSCALITWYVYTRRGGLLHDIERRRAPGPAATATATAE